MSDHVPELRYAKLSSSAGTAATADPVSWLATATTGTAPKPVRRCASAVKVPIMSPDIVMRPNFSGESPSSFIISGSHCLVRGSIICAVDAMVYSVTALPVSM